MMNQQAQYGLDHWSAGLNSANIGVQRALSQYTSCTRVIGQLTQLVQDPTADVGMLPVHRENMVDDNGESVAVEYPLDQQRHLAATWMHVYEDRLVNIQNRLFEAWAAVDNVNDGVKKLLAAARSAVSQAPALQPQQPPSPQPPPPQPIASGVQVQQHS
jgi:hypothetical protein